MLHRHGQVDHPEPVDSGGCGRNRKIRSTKLEIRNKFEMRMIETDQSAPNEPNSPGSWRAREIRSTKLEIRSTKLEIRKLSDGLRMGIDASNEPNLPRFGPENEGGGEKQSQSERAGDPRLRIADSWQRVRGMTNKPNLPRFGPKNGGRVENKANLCGREAGDCGLRIWDWGFEAAGAEDVKQSQFGEAASRRAWPALRDGRRNTGDRECQTNPICDRPDLGELSCRESVMNTLLDIIRSALPLTPAQGRGRERRGPVYREGVLGILSL